VTIALEKVISFAFFFYGKRQKAEGRRQKGKDGCHVSVVRSTLTYLQLYVVEDTEFLNFGLLNRHQSLRETTGDQLGISDRSRVFDAPRLL
jgi:hypothetical protein